MQLEDPFAHTTGGRPMLGKEFPPDFSRCSGVEIRQSEILFILKKRRRRLGWHSFCGVYGCSLNDRSRHSTVRKWSLLLFRFAILPSGLSC